MNESDKPEHGGERISLHGHDPEEVLRTLLKIDPDAEPAEQDAEAWAREHVHLDTTDHHKNGLTWVATIKADGLTFEGRAAGTARKRDALRQRATDAAVRDYLDFVDRMSAE
jgi:hypothetical protein